MDDHARFAAAGFEVPLPLDRADRDRSVRSEKRLLRLPTSSSRRPTAGRAGRWSARISRPRTRIPRLVRRHRRRQPRAVRAGSGLRDRAVGGGARPDLGGHQRRQGLVHAETAAANGTTCRRTSAACRRWGVVSKIEPSHFNGGTAYLAVDAHLNDSREPYIFKTTDYGATWKRVNGDLPNTHPLSYVKAIAENPNKQGQLFAGTGHGFFYSSDDGGHWTEAVDGPAARAGELGRRAETVPRRCRFHLRARHLRARRHHAARTDDDGDDRCGGRTCLRRGRRSAGRSVDAPR